MSNLKRAAHRMRDWVFQHDHARRGARVRVTMPVVIERAEGADVCGVVRDVSSSGLRLECGPGLAEGESVKIRVLREAFAGEVLWVRGDEVGVSARRHA